MKTIQLTYKLKVILIIAVGLIMSYLVYSKKISHTIERVQKINNMNESSQQDELLLDNQIQELTKQKQEIEDALSFSEKSSFESFLIDEITSYNSAINITNVSDLYSYKEGKYSVFSVYITLENNFKTILKLTDYIEKELKSVNIISINYYSKKVSFNSSKKKLYATIYLQNIKNS